MKITYIRVTRDSSLAEIVIIPSLRDHYTDKMGRRGCCYILMCTCMHGNTSNAIFKKSGSHCISFSFCIIFYLYVLFTLSLQQQGMTLSRHKNSLYKINKKSCIHCKYYNWIALQTQH